MRILITNDDGIHSHGLRVLAQRLGKLGAVSVIAPDRERSGTGHAITVHHPLRVTRYPTFAEGVREAMSVDGTPSDCVKLGIEAILSQRPDIVVSGINPGPNLGTDVIYSGTVAGAVEAILSDVPAIAVSTVATSVTTTDLEFMSDWIADLIQMGRRSGFPDETLLNVNFPACSPDQIKGVKITRPGVRRYRNVFDKRIDPRGRVYYWMAGDPVDLDQASDTDAGAVFSDYLSVSPVKFNLTDTQTLDTVSRWGLSV